MFKTLKKIDYHPEQIDILVNSRLSSIISTLLAPLFALYLLYGEIATNIIYTVVIIQIITLYFRLTLSIKINNIKEHRQKNKYLKYYLLTIFTAALVISSLFVLTIVYLNNQLVLFYFTGLLFLITGAIISLGSVYHAIIIYVMTILFTAIMGLIYLGDLVIYQYLAISAVFFAAMFSTASYKVYNLLSKNIKQNEDLLEKNESFKSLLDSTIEAIVMINKETHEIIDGNRSSLKLLNLDKEEFESLKGKSLFNFVPEYEVPKILNALKNEYNEPYEITLKTLSNKTFPVLISSRNMSINGKQVRVASIVDLSAIKEREQQLFSQSKLASMGEMIGNISHQWRQPLSVLSTIASGLILKKEMDMLSDDDFNKSMYKIINDSQFLSTTIDTFKDFLKSNKTLENVIIQEQIKNMSVLFLPTLLDNKINFITKINIEEKTNLNICVNELSHVLINIINNAKDILLERNIKNPSVILDLIHEKNSVIITIQDNAGGVPQEIKDKIFDPYFTTKHESQGTGLGLHMSYNIVVKSLKGKLYVLNNEHGAKFHIELPL